jgi:hypothetical protein
MIQAIGSTILYFRRRRRTELILTFDVLNFQASFCTIVVAASSAYLSWSPGWISHVTMAPTEYREKSFTEFQKRLPAMAVSGLPLQAALEYWVGLRLFLPAWFSFGWYVLNKILYFVVYFSLFSIDSHVDELNSRILKIFKRLVFWWNLGLLLGGLELFLPIYVGIYQLRHHGGGWKDPWSEKLFVI